jgi:predicted dehydrogenase
MLASSAMQTDALVIVGCGWIARRHARAAQRLGIPMIFVSRDAAKARAYAREFGGVAAFDRYDEAMRDARAGAVVVCTPHDRHLEDVLAALRSGKDVLVEKPIGRTLDEADRMIETAGATGQIVMVAENFHFMPAFRHVEDIVERGRLGPLRELHLIARGYRRHAGWRSDLEVSGGGALIDGGIHYVHLLRWWGGMPRRIFAQRPPQTLAGFAGEDAITFLAELPSGALGLVSNSLGAPGVPKLQYSTVTGRDGTCLFDNRGRFVITRASGGFGLRLYRRDLRGHEQMLRAFRASLASRKPPETDGAAGRADLAIVLAAYRSVTERGPVDIRC